MAQAPCQNSQLAVSYTGTPDPFVCTFGGLTFKDFDFQNEPAAYGGTGPGFFDLLFSQVGRQVTVTYSSPTPWQLHLQTPFTPNTSSVQYVSPWMAFTLAAGSVGRYWVTAGQLDADIVGTANTTAGIYGTRIPTPGNTIGPGHFSFPGQTFLGYGTPTYLLNTFYLNSTIWPVDVPSGIYDDGVSVQMSYASAWSVTFDVAPEPSTWILLATGLGVVGLIGRKRLA